mmetsp:Transcript_19077/g.30760  ORF Transcript_19077/g.30760 Transcript_19077/m.30760 type:complete len:226 (+) Transcript_19077:321-998(+)
MPLITVGVVEWNLNNVAGKTKSFYTMEEVAEMLRSYIEHFFGCEVCRMNFLHGFDSCNFNRCERLTDNIGDFDDWKELPLWLFEFHNGVNSRLMRERAESKGQVATSEELRAVEWPDRKHCPTCWHDDGRFDPDKIYLFMQLIYWPDELLSEMDTAELIASTSGRKRAQEEDPPLETGFESWVYSLAGLVVASFVLSAASWVQKRRDIRRTGKHKKDEDDPSNRV